MGAFGSAFSSLSNSGALSSIGSGVSNFASGIVANKQAKANAAAIQQSAKLDIMRIRRQARQVRSSQQAGYAKAGVTLEGSPLSVMIDSAAQAELDVAITKYNADVQAAQATEEGKGDMMKGIMKGAGTLLNSGMDWMQSKDTTQTGVMENQPEKAGFFRAIPNFSLGSGSTTIGQAFSAYSNLQYKRKWR